MISLGRFPTCQSWSRLRWRAIGRAEFSNTPKPPKAFEPLRILFCGSDDFSIASLRRLSDASRLDPSFIQSVDVVCKQAKPSGRGLKTTRDVEIKGAAQELRLPLHEITTFTGWSPPSNINLILAVSFGLFIPPRVLDLAKYGGLNVHPSLLPELRGPAPLQHALLMGKKTTGLSLQTLDPIHFDRGIIIAQETYDLPNSGLCDLNELRTDIAESASEFLVRNLRQGAFLSPLKDSRLPGLIESHAPKLGRSDACVDWQEWTADHILCAQRAISPLWSRWKYYSDGKGKGSERVEKLIRVQFHDLHPAEPSRIGTPEAAGTIVYAAGAMGIWTIDGQLLMIGGMTVEGRKKQANPITEVAYLLKLDAHGYFV